MSHPLKDNPSPSTAVYTRKEEQVIDKYLSRVIELRDITTSRQLYEQLPYITEYFHHSQQYGELNILPRAPSQRYIETKL